MTCLAIKQITRNKRVPFQTSGGCIQINHCTFDPYWCYLSVYQKIEIAEIPGWYKTKSDAVIFRNTMFQEIRLVPIHVLILTTNAQTTNS